MFQPSKFLSDLLKEMPHPRMKRFQPSKFFACGRLISCVLIKEMQNSGVKWFHTSKFYACGGLISDPI